MSAILGTPPDKNATTEESHQLMSVIVTEISAPVMRSRLREGLRVYTSAMGYPRGVEHARAPMWAEHILRSGWGAVAAFDTSGCPDAARSAQPAPSTQSIPSSTAPPPGSAATRPTDPAHASTTDSATTVATPGHAPHPVAIPDAAPLVGVAYGYRGAPGYWWDRQVRTGLHDRGTDTSVLDDYFELTEIHVLPSAQGSGVGARLLSHLLRDRTESRVLLSTPEVPQEENRAWHLYRRTGFGDILRGFQFLGDHRPFAVLGRTLPLPPAPQR